MKGKNIGHNFISLNFDSLYRSLMTVTVVKLVQKLSLAVSFPVPIAAIERAHACAHNLPT